jgi:hypothetical protein
MANMVPAIFLAKAATTLALPLLAALGGKLLEEREGGVLSREDSLTLPSRWENGNVYTARLGH